jgi:hypothetical protein
MQLFSKLPLRWQITCFLLFISLTITFSVAYSELKRRTPFWYRYQELQLRMTEEEAKWILGEPTVEDQASGLGATVLSWFEGEQRIVVYTLPFDERGPVVVKKGFLPKSLWERLRDPSNSSFITYP